ncbi:MAG: endopeptidase La [Firmicutes bacterium]|jgi:ATP-dependent Lon protease|nr:endopeptidase La [Bacillota bacterium]
MAEVRNAREYPLLPLRGVYVFPSMVVPLEVGRARSVNAIEEAATRDRLLVLATQKDVEVDQPSPADIYPVGALAEIKQVARNPGGNMRVVVEGKARVRIEEYVSQEPCFRVVARELSDVYDKPQEIDVLMKALLQEYEQYVRTSRKAPLEALASLGSIREPGKLADTIAAHLSLRNEDKQRILEAVSVSERLEAVLGIISREAELADLEKRINARVRKQIEKTQREYYLREQMKAIQRELGERDDKSSEGDEYRQKISQLGLPKEVEEKALKEVERLDKMPPMAAEAVVVRTYLDWIVSLPWTVQTEDRLDIGVVERILDEDHYGLEKVKERIVEFLAIRQLVKKLKGPILCLIGPPGVGKTSLAKSIARALQRKFVRISLGGIRDEAEIRGHRRTYVGALPGRIIQGMKQAGSKNPVFLMDEIDKLSSDFRGDPASALLEVLDPEQNSGFSDHYLEIPFDLSNVMFVTTANVSHSIPKPLLDRMEVINIPGYTEEEKIKIAEKFLVPKQMTEHGLEPAHLQVTEAAIRSIIRGYTREAGVRNLEREIASICRKSAKQVVAGRDKPIKVTARNLKKFIGVQRYRYGKAERENEVGIAMGVAVTDAGGDVMPIEVSLMKGKGNLLLTGKLGDVMKESAQAGFSYVRSRTGNLGIDQDFHEKYDIHVHVPEGAIPKDGPSAGITMAAALVSALTSRPVRNDVAMTGEITLRGRVLPVGGIKEKVLAAHRAGIETMIMPGENGKDLEEVPANVRRKMKFVLVDHMDEVLKHALAGTEMSG